MIEVLGRSASWGWLTLVSLVLLATLCAGAADAGAAARLDRGYGDGGVVEVDLPLVNPGEPSQGLRQTVTARDGSVYASASCRVNVGCTPMYAVFRYGKRGELDSSFGGGRGYFLLQADQDMFFRLNLDSRNRPLLLALVGSEDKVRIRRLSRRGLLDRTFGEGGVAEFSCECEDTPTFVPDDDGGGTLVMAETWLPVRANGYRGIGTVLRTVRMRADGSLARGYGQQGVAEFGVRGMEWGAWGGAASTPGGGIYLAGHEMRGREASSPVALARVSAKGRLDTSFRHAARRSLAELPERFTMARSFDVGAVVVRRRGKIDLLGRADHAGRGYALRLRPDGRWFRPFGSRGVRSLPWAIETATAAYDGATVAAMSDRENGSTLLRILPGGRLDPAFGLRGTPVRGLSGEGYSVDAITDRRIAVTTRGGYACRSYCRSTPALARYLEPPRRKR